MTTSSRPRPSPSSLVSTTVTTTAAPKIPEHKLAPLETEELQKPSSEKDRNDESYSDEYDESADAYDDPLQFFLRMKQSNKKSQQEVETTDSDGYFYADDETGL